MFVHFPFIFIRLRTQLFFILLLLISIGLVIILGKAGLIAKRVLRAKYLLLKMLSADTAEVYRQ